MAPSYKLLFHGTWHAREPQKKHAACWILTEECLNKTTVLGSKRQDLRTRGRVRDIAHIECSSFLPRQFVKAVILRCQPSPSRRYCCLVHQETPIVNLVQPKFFSWWSWSFLQTCLGWVLFSQAVFVNGVTADTLAFVQHPTGIFIPSPIHAT